MDKKIGNKTYAQLINSGKSNEDIAKCDSDVSNTNFIKDTTRQVSNQSSFLNNSEKSLAVIQNLL